MARKSATAEDPDVSQAIRENFTSEGIEVLLGTQVRKVEGLSGQRVQVHAETDSGERTIEASDFDGRGWTDSEHAGDRA